jgi:hypothetical protein
VAPESRNFRSWYRLILHKTWLARLIEEGALKGKCMTIDVDKLLTKGLVVGVGLIAACAIATTVYDPKVELYPGRTMPRSQADRTLALRDNPLAHQGAS